MNARPNRPLLFSEGIILAVLSAFAYTCAYLYERGYAFAFGVPPELIDLRWVTFFGAAFSLVIGATMFGLLYLASRTFPRSKSKWPHLVSAIVPSAAITLAAVMIAGFARWRFLLVAATICVVISGIAESISWLIERRRTAEPEPRRSAIGRAIASQPHLVILAALFMNLTLPLSAFVGLGAALDTTDFLITSGVPTAVVVRVYGDKIVTAEYDTAAKALIPVYRVLPLTDSARVFTRVHLPGVVPVCPPSSISTGNVVYADTIPSEKLRRYLGDEAASFQERCTLYRKLLTGPRWPWQRK